MRRAVGLLVVMVVIAVPARAFDGYEHRSVSNAAVIVAAKYAEGTADPKFLAQALALATKEKETFGDLTVAADWFQDVTQLTTGEAFKAVRRRQRIYMAWRKGISLHRNMLHFQRQALCTYLMLHRNAVALAASPDTWEASLYTEAVALHFLQDFFSAGHFVTPRKHSNDAVAGSLHDHFGHTGLKVSLAMSNDQTLAEPWRSLAAAAKSELGVLPDAVRYNDADLTSLDGRTKLSIGGDTYLNDIPGQRLLVLLVSAQSVAEVLNASHNSSAPAEHIAVCFNERWAQRDGPHAHSFLENPASKGKRGGPEAALRLETSPPVKPKPNVTTRFLKSDACEKEVPRCEAFENWLVRFAVPPDAYSEQGNLEAKGVQFTVAGLPAVRRSISVGRLIYGTDPRNTVMVHDEENKPLDRYFTSSLVPLYATGNLLFIESDRYRAIGVRGELAYDLPLTAAGATLMFGPNIYKFLGGRATRLDVGLKLTYGFDVMNIALLLERGHQVDDHGRFHQRYFITPGVELTLSNSWYRKFLHFPRRPCCKER
jgi:hypothetical protein